MYGGHEKVLRQTVIGMIAGARLAEHENPGEATVLILHGRVRLAADGKSWDAARGDMLIMPNHRHSLEALEDSAVLTDGRQAVRIGNPARPCGELSPRRKLGSVKIMPCNAAGCRHTAIDQQTARRRLAGRSEVRPSRRRRRTASCFVTSHSR